LEFLREAGARNVVVSGDPAIAYHSRYRNPPAWVRPDRPLRIAINTGDCSGNLWGRPDDIQHSLVALARWLREEKHHVELLPVWNKDLDPCQQVARIAGLPESTVNVPLTTHDKFLKKVETFDLLIAVKLHAAVLASAANVPCVVLEYQPKCLDFAASIGWERFTIRTSELTSAKLIDRVAHLIEQLTPARQELSRSVGKLEQQFDEYFRRIEPLILGKGAAGYQESSSRTAAGFGI
jgi:polysaccharide pyruvyl transferase WcaK-like protein